MALKNPSTCPYLCKFRNVSLSFLMHFFLRDTANCVDPNYNGLIPPCYALERSHKPFVLFDKCSPVLQQSFVKTTSHYLYCLSSGQTRNSLVPIETTVNDDIDASIQEGVKDSDKNFYTQ